MQLNSDARILINICNDLIWDIHFVMNIHNALTAFGEYTRSAKYHTKKR